MARWPQYFFSDALNHTLRYKQNLYQDTHDPVATIFFSSNALNHTLRCKQNLYQDKHDPLRPERRPAEEEGGYNHNWKSESFQYY